MSKEKGNNKPVSMNNGNKQMATEKKKKKERYSRKKTRKKNLRKTTEKRKRKTGGLICFHPLKVTLKSPNVRDRDEK